MSVDFNIEEDFDILEDIAMVPPTRRLKRYRTRIDPFQLLTNEEFYEKIFGRNVHQSDIGDLHGISQPTVSRIIAQISRKLAPQLPNFVSFPSTSWEIQQVKSDFFQIAGFPGVIGTIDTRDVNVCDANCKITDIVARSHGSRHDARIWNSSRLKDTLETTRNTHNGVLLGDAGYPLSNIVFTPVKSPQNRQEEGFNKYLSHRNKKQDKMSKRAN